VSDESNPYRAKASTRRDVLHDQQLLRDLALINARMLQEFGPLPTGGLPVDAKRRPVLPQLPLPSAHTEIQEDDAMKFSPIVVATSLALNACAPMSGSLDSQRSNQETEAQETDSPSLRHKFRVNPNPKRRYDITMTIKDAPGPFGYAGFGVQYDAPDCIYWSDKIAGTTSSPMRMLKLPIRKIDDATYVTTVYLDAMLDENYYGDGVCHWQLTDVTGGLKATGADGETGFGIDISPKLITDQESVTKYFWKGGYPSSRVPNYADFGFTDPNKYRQELRDELFTITLASMEIQP